MKKYRDRFKKYIPFAKAGAKTLLAYKATIFMWLIISLVDVGFIIFLYQAIYASSPDSVINGFNFQEIIVYMTTSFLFSFLVLGNETSWNIFEDIKEGTIANTLTKPVSYRLRHLFTAIGSALTSICLIMIPFFIILYGIFIGLGFITVTWTFIFDVIIFIVLTFLAIIITDAMGYFIGLLTFFTEHMFGLNMFKSAVQSFFSGQLLPLSYMGAFGVFCSYTPFAFLNSTPVLTLMGAISTTQAAIYVAVALGWVILLEGINKLIFKHCVRRLSVQGG